MKNEEILRHVDHTLLSAVSSWDNIAVLCDEAVTHNMASVCIPPSYIKRVAEMYGDHINICTVLGFPLGYDTTETKIFSLKKALDDGCNEFDMVINLGDVKNSDYDKITTEVSAMKKAAAERILKVIIETCYLTESEKVRLCECANVGGADYIKTSTGFGTAGATMQDILLFKKHIGKHVKIKAAGGIRTREDMTAFLDAGCQRLGTSSALKILQGRELEKY